MTGKALSALLATLRRAGVVEYETTALRLRLSPASPGVVAAQAAQAVGEPIGMDVPDDDPPPQDWRFALEDLSNLNANANRGKLGS